MKPESTNEMKTMEDPSPRIRRISYIKTGGATELQYAERFNFVPEPWRTKLKVEPLIAALNATQGAYYSLQNAGANFLQKARIDINKEILKAGRQKDAELEDRLKATRTLIGYLVGGSPRILSDFIIKPHKNLSGENGTVIRVYTFTNQKGEVSARVPVKGIDIASPERFRLLCVSAGNFNCLMEYHDLTHLIIRLDSETADVEEEEG